MAEVEQRLRLNQIKLVGFKSFVDPTIITLPSNRVAVVGPNGCGKSNVIDAVRWVMGESSAKNLRGDSMADVIFNGAKDRKPVGQAKVELVFDNPNGAIGGEYAAFSEISICRQVTRDGQSQYFLNNVRCRRRDIIDIFLGTGLGPRSYAIISQGTISRIIEARPEELRVYLEEAAGISKYKERRRETENRMKHTRENLERLTDLREELEKQLNHLKRQAANAERYQVLKQEESVLRGKVLATRYQNMQTKIDQYRKQEAEYQLQLDAMLAEQQHIDTNIEKGRQDFREQQDAFNVVQAKYYDAGAQVARFEQSLQHQTERCEQLTEDMHSAKNSLQQQQSLWQQDQLRIKTLQQQCGELQPEIEQSATANQQSQSILREAEQAAQNWQQQWDEFSKTSADSSQQAQVQQTRIQHAEKTVEQGDVRKQRLQEEMQRLSDSSLQSDVEQINAKIEEIEQVQQQHEQDLETSKQSMTKLREENKLNNRELAAKRSELQSLHGRYASLQTLQQAAMDKNNSVVNQWLDNNQLADKPRLLETLDVQAGWQNAVETVLGNHLQAICVDGVDSVCDALTSFTQGKASFIDMQQQTEFNSDSALTTLCSKIQSQNKLAGLLAGVYVAEDLVSAVRLRNQLKANESIITPEGIWLGANWLRVSKDENEQQGVLAREHELQELSQQISSTESAINNLQQALDAGDQKLKELEAAIQQQQKSCQEVYQQLSQQQAQVRIKQARYEQFKQRQQQLEQELLELQQQVKSANEELLEARGLWQTAMQEMEQQADMRERLTAERDQTKGSLSTIKQQASIDSEKAHEIALRHQRLQTELDSKLEQQQRMQQQLEELTERQEQLQENLYNAKQPIETYQAQLEEALQQRLSIEEHVTVAKQKVGEIEHQLRERESLRTQIESKLIALREQLQTARLKAQDLQGRCAGMLEQLEELEQTLEAILQSLTEDDIEATLESNLQQVEQRITRLGAINLAAIDEYKVQEERKTYLDAQDKDLTEALNLLEEAIRKIDIETKQRFQDTYNSVNEKFKALFPKIFGGGTAMLELTGDDLLDTGVAVMARPPGKRNSTIHLLSGGEKALTAIALVFAIFQLNPAPFCMLDEVDAPLDDANVARYANLVNEMSEEIQFIFISHNKLAVEMADHLIGVTMKEPGVSRLVSVDMKEAMEMAEVA